MLINGIIYVMKIREEEEMSGKGNRWIIIISVIISVSVKNKMNRINWVINVCWLDVRFFMYGLASMCWCCCSFFYY